jgi:enamine deaminase RidA (YjgF/YER057c/UK114 family)
MSTTARKHPEEVLADLGLALPPPATPRANYVKGVRTGNLVFLSGHGPLVDDKHEFIGKLGADADVAFGQRAAQQVALNSMATLKAVIGDLDRVTKVVKLLCFVNSDPSFTETYKVANGASDLLIEMFGSARGTHARSAVGMATLPFGISVEIEMVIEVAPD